jgi:hypothetical protein
MTHRINASQSGKDRSRGQEISLPMLDAVRQLRSVTMPQRDGLVSARCERFDHSSADVTTSTRHQYTHRRS